MKKECALIFSKTKIVTAVNAAVLYTKLLQISSGAVYNADNSYTLLDTDRYELILDLAEARPHVIVFFNWQHQKDQLVKEAIKRNLTYGVYDGTTSDTMRRKLVDQFQAGALRILFAHPQSAGHGLTLTKGVATIWSSPTSNVEHYLQGLKRIHRIGQKEKTETIMVLTSNTIDEKVYKSLMAKNTKMSNFLNFLKESL
jgi:SNF2 family DNA or RNA helicase